MSSARCFALMSRPSLKRKFARRAVLQLLQSKVNTLCKISICEEFLIRSRDGSIDTSSPKFGLRERKKQQTRATIERVALGLFADRAGMTRRRSPRSPTPLTSLRERSSPINAESKEDILFCAEGAFLDQLKERLEQRPPGTTTVDAIRDFIASIAPPDEQALLRKRIIVNSPALQMKIRAHLGQLEPLLAESIAKDLDAGPGDIRPPLRRIDYCCIHDWCATGYSRPRPADRSPTRRRWGPSTRCSSSCAAGSRRCSATDALPRRAQYATRSRKSRVPRAERGPRTRRPEARSTTKAGLRRRPGAGSREPGAGSREPAECGSSTSGSTPRSLVVVIQQCLWQRLALRRVPIVARGAVPWCWRRVV